MRAWRAVLDSADVQGRGFEVDLLPAQVNDFGRSQAVAIAQKYDERVALTRRFFPTASIRPSTSAGVRCSLVRSSEFGSGRGVTVRFTVVGATGWSFAFAIIQASARSILFIYRRCWPLSISVAFLDLRVAHFD
jgi:hypothetical protein